MSTPPSQADRGPPVATVDLPAVLAENWRWLRTVLIARGVDRSSLDDVLQEVALAAAKGVSKLKDPDRAPAWLYRIAVVQALQYRRQTGRRRRLIERHGQRDAPSAEAREHDPLAWLLAGEARRLVRGAIAMLSPQDAEILLLKYTEDWSYRQLAERLGISESAIEARLHRARERMRQAIARLAPELVPQAR